MLEVDPNPPPIVSSPSALEIELPEIPRPFTSYVDTYMYSRYASLMKRVNALQVRQSLGRILDQLDRVGEPILVEKGREPRAVLVPLPLFRERFVDKTVHEERLALERRIAELRARVRARRGPRVERLVRELRGPIS